MKGSTHTHTHTHTHTYTTYVRVNNVVDEVGASENSTDVAATFVNDHEHLHVATDQQVEDILQQKM